MKPQFVMKRPAPKPFLTLHGDTTVVVVATSFVTHTHLTLFLSIKTPTTILVAHVPAHANTAIPSGEVGRRLGVPGVIAKVPASERRALELLVWSAREMAC
jgi:hypothetical protein